MALSMYLTLKGQRQGDIKGSVIQKGREESIRVIAVSHNIVSPRDPASGQPTGQRRHDPFVITKQLDQATPLLYNALATNENITEWRLDYWQTLARGKEALVYSVKLTNANIGSIRHGIENMSGAEPQQTAIVEEIQFFYQKIEWTWLDGGIIAGDDWSSKLA